MTVILAELLSYGIPENPWRTYGFDWMAGKAQLFYAAVGSALIGIGGFRFDLFLGQVTLAAIVAFSHSDS
jgi:hypothetical protein